jgi:serine phosphatase RsbU (regulator of sigma subunit)
MRQIFVVSFFLLLNLGSFSQQNSIDSLKRELKNANEYSKVSLLNQLARLTLYDNLEESEEYSKQAIENSTIDSEDKALAYHNLGLVYYFKGIPDKAIDCYNKSVEINSRLSNFSQLSKTYNNLGAIYNETGDNENSIKYFNESLIYSRQIGDSVGVARALGNVANVYQNIGELAQALKIHEYALSLKKELGDSVGYAIALVNLGVVYKNLGDYPNALNMYFEALAIHERNSSIRDIGVTMYSIGNIYFEWTQYDQAKQYFIKSLDFFEKSNHIQGQGYAFNQLGRILIFEENYRTAYEYYQTALEKFEVISDKNGVANVYSDISTLFISQNDFKNGMVYIERAKEKYEEIGDRQGVAKSLLTIAGIKLSLKDLAGAKKLAFESLRIATSIKVKRVELEALNILTAVHKEEGEFEKAYEYIVKATHLKDSIYNEEKSRQIAELNTLYETQKKEKEIVKQKAELEKKNADLSHQRTLLRSSFGGLVALVIIIALVVYAYVDKRRVNRQIVLKNKVIELKNQELDIRNEEIESQRDQLLKQNKEITDSIEYAQRIQSALLPPRDFIEKELGDHFILYLPKNIVSGDFYWVKTIEDYTLIAIADCTGHGISGAFMSILGISLLNEVVKEGTFDSASLLNHLRASIKTTLRQTNSPNDARDGMDMSMCILDRKKKKIQYAGAFIPLIIIKNNEIIEYTPDKMPIGVFPVEKESYTNHEIEMDGSESFYLFTDGYYDQFGGNDYKKFKRQNLQSLMLDLHRLPMNDQKDVLAKKFEEWKGNNQQFDDVLVFGFSASCFV